MKNWKGHLMTKLIVFDMDGTIYDTKKSYLPAIKKLLQKHNIKIPSESKLNSFIGEPSHVFKDWFEEIGLDTKKDDIFNEFEEYELESVEEFGELYTGVIELFDYLIDNKCLIALCTNAPTNYLNKVLSKFDLNKYFTMIKHPLSKDETKEKMLAEISSKILDKNHNKKKKVNTDVSNERSFEIISEMNLENAAIEEKYMIGDRYHDYQAASHNGFTSIGALYGYGDDEPYKADFQVSSVREIKEIIKCSPKAEE